MTRATVSRGGRTKTSTQTVLRTYDPVQQSYLGRLKWLDDFRHNVNLAEEGSAFSRRLVDHALFALWTECRDCGVGEEADELMKRVTEAAFSSS